MSRRNILYRTIYQENTIQSGLPEQLIIRVGKGCNFRCIFCNVAENESVLSLKSSLREILAITFYKLKYSTVLSEHINITISGGEPSIFQRETIFILKYFEKYFRDRGIHTAFDLQSNASNIDIVFARKLKELGIQQALISSHAHDPVIFRDIIGVKYDVMGLKFEHGVDSLLSSGIAVTFNSVINKINLSHYFDHIVYLSRKYPDVQLFNIGCVQPHGMAAENFNRLIAKYDEIAPVYSRVVAYLKFHGKRVHSHLVGPPLCYMDDSGSSMEYMHNKNLYSHANPSDQTLIQSINDDNKIQGVDCYTCRAKRVCSGVWKEFEGVQELKPIVYDIFLHSSKGKKNIYFGSLQYLKKLYDGGERQFFFLVDDISVSDLSDSIKKVKSFGYNWITLVVCNTVFMPDDYSAFSGTNIQVPYSRLSQIEISAIQRYNTTVPFQFRIHIDIIYDLVHLSTEDKMRIFTLSLDSNTLLRMPRKWKKYFSGNIFVHYFIPVVGK